MKLAAAMERAGMKSQRELGLKLGHSDGSLVGKWLNGKVKRIESLEHLRALPKIFHTPKDYWSGLRPADRLAVLEEQAVTVGDVHRLTRPLWEATEFLARGNRREALRVLSEAADK